VKTYLELLRQPGVFRIMLAQLTARFPFGMLSIAFLLHVEKTQHSYAIAGLVLGGLAAGQAVAGPFTSRLMGTFGMRPVLIVTLAIATATIIVMALAPLPPAALVVLGMIAGCAMPPIQPAVRTIYPTIVTESHLTALFTIDASAQEIIWMVGPVLTVFTATQVSTEAAILVAAAFLVGGGAWFVSTKAVGQAKIHASRIRFGGVLRQPAVLVSALVGFLFVASFAAGEAGVVAVFGNGSTHSGWVLGLWAAGSLVGGLLWGNAPVSQWALTIRTSAVAVAMVLTLFSTDFWWLCVMLFIAGIGVAPALAVLFSNVSFTVAASSAAEAYAWIGSAQLVGAGIGSALAGLSIDALGSSGGLVVSAILAGVTAVAALVTVRWSPDLRDASPR
jgi:MFS family permease